MNTDFSQPYNPQASTSARPAGKLSDARLKKGLPWLYGLVLPAVMGFCLYSYEKETLFRIQELNLFLPDAAFYHGFSAYPGGTLEWMACFLTQFFYYPALGTALLVMLWAALCGVTRSAFRLSAAGSILTPKSRTYRSSKSLSNWESRPRPPTSTYKATTCLTR